MRTSLIIAVTFGVLTATAFIGSRPAEAARSSVVYCLDYNEGGMDCSFTSRAECEATADGEGAECFAVTPPRRSRAAMAAKRSRQEKQQPRVDR
jgi:uncharacterized protein DUF3551